MFKPDASSSSVSDDKDNGLQQPECNRLQDAVKTW